MSQSVARTQGLQDKATPCLQTQQYHWLREQLTVDSVLSRRRPAWATHFT